MTYHLYLKPDGSGVVTVTEMDLTLLPFEKYTYLGASEEKPDVEGKLYVAGKWVWQSGEPEYAYHRRVNFPRPQELFHALWNAMNNGTLPKVPGFYDRIDALYKRFPEK